MIRSITKELFHRLKIFCPWISYENKFRFAEVDPGKLYRSAELSNQALDYFVEKYKIKTLIILRSSGDESKINYAKSRGLNICHIAIDSGMPPKDQDIEKFFGCVKNQYNQPALVHCLQGRDRTGCMCLLYRMGVMKWNFSDAWAEMLAFGFLSFPWHHKAQAGIKHWINSKRLTQ